MEQQYDVIDSDGLLFLWQQILSRFVVKEEGKGLSTNDLTDELLQKIQNAQPLFFRHYGLSRPNRPERRLEFLPERSALSNSNHCAFRQNGILYWG